MRARGTGGATIIQSQKEGTEKRKKEKKKEKLKYRGQQEKVQENKKQKKNKTKQNKTKVKKKQIETNQGKGVGDTILVQPSSTFRGESICHPPLHELLHDLPLLGCVEALLARVVDAVHPGEPAHQLVEGDVDVAEHHVRVEEGVEGGAWGWMRGWVKR